MNNSKLNKALQRAHEFIRASQWVDAKAHLINCCKKFPKSFDVWHLYGAVCGQTNDIKQSLFACKRAVKINPRHDNALYNLGMALSKSGLLDESKNAYLKSLKINPNNAAAHHNLGNIYKDLHQYDDAISHLNKTVMLVPGKADAFFSLGTIYVELNQRDSALSNFEKCLALDSSQKTKIDYFLRFINGSDINYQSHVAQLHDNHADTFDSHLTKGLGYDIPRILYEQYNNYYRRDDGDLITILDLGCGTGLCGREFQSISKSMIGVDLSPKMLEIAKQTNTYDKLIEDDILHYITQLDKSFDLILAADVFIYIGDVDDIIKRCVAILNPGGVIAFSIESVDDAPFKLRISGRYAHSLDYIQSLADRHGLIVDKYTDVEIRKESGVGIKGKTLYLKPASTHV
jgi:predicted TPR repeat methyltransferase